jgi:hypothetical protein
MLNGYRKLNVHYGAVGCSETWMLRQHGPMSHVTSLSRFVVNPPVFNNYKLRSLKMERKVDGKQRSQLKAEQCIRLYIVFKIFAQNYTILYRWHGK